MFGLQTTLFSIVLLVWFFDSTVTALFNAVFLKVFFLKFIFNLFFGDIG